MSTIKRLINTFDNVTSLVFVFVTGLFILSLSRLLLIVWQWERVSAVSDLSLLLQGIRADVIIMSMLLIPLVLLFPLSGFRATQTIWRSLLVGWSLCLLSFLIFMEIATPVFLKQYDLRPNRLFIEYLSYPREVLSMLWNGFLPELLMGSVASAVCILVLFRLLRPLFKIRGRLRLATTLLVWPLLIVLTALGARSTLGHRPVNPAFFAMTSDPMVNSLIINSGWSVAYAVYNLKHEARSSEIYGSMPFNKALKLVSDASNIDSRSFLNVSSAPALHTQQPSVTRDKPLNLVIILQESMGGTFIESLGGYKGLTPNLDQLRAEGWSFERLFATGTRSVRGIEAVVAGFLPTPARSTVKLPASQNNFATLASVLRQHQYHSEFIYGGEAHFDNMQSFFMGNGFDGITDERHYSDPEFVGSWGVSDEDLFRKTHERLQQLHQGDAPFFSLVFTSSNHEPFEFPDGKIDLVTQPKADVKNAVKYADFAMGAFFKQAKRADYWQDTLFLVVADHDSRAYGDALIPVKNFRIPAVILGADIIAEKITSVASQVDLAPTLLSLMGVETQHPMLGRDLSKTEERNRPGRAVMQFYDTFAYLEGRQITILRPEKEPVTGSVDLSNNQLILKGKADPDSTELALAHALLPSYLYRKRYYNLGEAPDTRL